MTPAAYRRRFDIAAPDVTSGARLAALRFAARDGAALDEALGQSGVAVKRAGGAFVVGSESAMGAALVFEAGR